MSTVFSSLYVIDAFNRPGTEDVEFWAQAQAAECGGVTEFEVMQAVLEQVVGREVDDDFVNYMLRKAEGLHVRGDDFGRIEIFEVANTHRAGVPVSIYVEVYYPDPECDMPERYADEIDPDWDEFVSLANEQASCIDEELEAFGFMLEETYDVIAVRADGYIKSYAEDMSWEQANNQLMLGNEAYLVGPEGHLDVWSLEIVEHVR